MAIMRKSLKLAIIEEFDTQSDFAESMGVREAYVSNVVRGRRTPSVEEQRVWASKLGRYRKTIFPEQ